MPRYTLQSWICPFKHHNHARLRLCGTCGHDKYQRSAVVHPSERACVDVSPDGSISVPGRTDIPLHPKQVAAGVRRVEVESATSGQYSLNQLEKMGLVHEASNWNSNGDNMPRIHEDFPDLTPKSVEQILAED